MTLIDDTARYRAALAEQLTEQLNLSSTWRDAFRAVPRHLFAPRFTLFHPPSGSYTGYDTTDPAQRTAALSAAYSDDTLITRFDESGNGISSSTEPSLMATMLEALELDPSHRVLEVGTGTGYNAALLCEVVGSSRVTTVDVDPELIGDARTALDTAGYAPSVRCGDGADGLAERAPFDRIIATCGADRVPTAWLDQLSADGAVLVNLSRGIALLRRTRPGSVSGPFLDRAGFMPLRSPSEPAQPQAGRVVSETGGAAETTRPTTFPEGVDFSTMSLFTSLIAARSRLVRTARDDQVTTWRWVHPASGSWARVEPVNQRVHQAGPRRLWDELEPVLTSWQRANRPGLERYGITAHQDGTHELWLDTPEGLITELPS
ncbi:methyltransferase domain-containing protein [Actinopolyspora saharensis]|uniref:Protein-L-isoaspartate O-methyltransferase n=1 Tax=Actinopolyspora saharensis TaxID=995062 RepID=A0A1H1FEN5_9ACTN|nr:methyltransferase domain-containing protein [Actinopolyspora saharensis]SDQ99264.1 protein-L-isoaspartate(D-aspartate) O-methyltransferase [Actinopolyspora saharensis]